jgi:hypothetical protein
MSLASAAPKPERVDDVEAAAAIAAMLTYSGWHVEDITGRQGSINLGNHALL